MRWKWLREWRKSKKLWENLAEEKTAEWVLALEKIPKKGTRRRIRSSGNEKEDNSEME